MKELKEGQAYTLQCGYSSFGEVKWSSLFQTKAHSLAVASLVRLEGLGAAGTSYRVKITKHNPLRQNPKRANSFNAKEFIGLEQI